MNKLTHERLHAWKTAYQHGSGRGRTYTHTHTDILSRFERHSISRVWWSKSAEQAALHEREHMHSTDLHINAHTHTHIHIPWGDSSAQGWKDPTEQVARARTAKCDFQYTHGTCCSWHVLLMARAAHDTCCSWHMLLMARAAHGTCCLLPSCDALPASAGLYHVLSPRTAYYHNIIQYLHVLLRATCLTMCTAHVVNVAVSAWPYPEQGWGIKKSRGEEQRTVIYTHTPFCTGIRVDINLFAELQCRAQSNQNKPHILIYTFWMSAPWAGEQT